MTTPSPDDRFAPPQAEVADVHPDGANQLASRWSRLGAALIDGLHDRIAGTMVISV